MRQQLKRLENCAQRDDSRLTMKSQLIAIVAAVLVVGCGPSVDIHEAARTGNIEAVKQHIASGTDVNEKYTDWGNSAPLHSAANGGHKEIAEQLIEAGVNIDESNNGNQTPLHKAAFEGRDEIVNMLIQKGAKVNPVIQSTGSFNGMTPVDFAIRQNKLKTVELLRKHGGKTGAELKAEGK